MGVMADIDARMFSKQFLVHMLLSLVLLSHQSCTEAHMKNCFENMLGSSLTIVVFTPVMDLKVSNIKLSIM